MVKRILVIDACQSCPYLLVDLSLCWCEFGGTENEREIKIDVCCTIPRWCPLPKAEGGR